MVHVSKYGGEGNGVLELNVVSKINAVPWLTCPNSQDECAGGIP
jgi:hypothetical protein